MYPHPGCCEPVYNVTKNSTPCSIDSSFASVGPYYVVNVSKQMNLCYQVLNEVFIKDAGLWVIKLSSDSVVNLTLFSLIFHSIRGEIQREEGQWKLGIRQADVTTTVLRTSHSWSREYIDFVIVHWICILTGPFVLNKIMVWDMYTNNYTAGIFISLLNSL